MNKRNLTFVVVFTILTFGLISCHTDSLLPSNIISSQNNTNQSRIQAAATYSLTNWMGSLNSTLTLAQITIPGTHDSGARFETFSGTAKCQNLTIAEQLAAGTRFLDIRCRHIGNAFTIHHGSVYQNINFDDVLNACFTFLNSNPTETILMSVKEEYNSSNITRTFEQTFDAYVQKNPTKWSLNSTIPTLSTVQGKIVLLRRFSASTTPKGINATSWADNATFTTGSLSVQDKYKVSNTDTKWTDITQQLTAAKNGSTSVLYLNFSSGYKSLLFGIPSITGVSNAINPKLTTYFTTNTSGRYGTVVMDFAEAAQNALVIQTNF